MSSRGQISNEALPQDLDGLPGWVPDGVRLYLSHVAGGVSLRALARNHGCHASTIMRQVRRFENRRDDPLVDDALNRLDATLREPKQMATTVEAAKMTAQCLRITSAMGEECPLEQEALSHLKHLARAGSLLIVAADLPKAVITGEDDEGVSHRIAVMDRHVAEAMALKDWLSIKKQGRVSSYVISASGRAALRDLSDPRDGIERGAEPAVLRRVRYGHTESPVSVLARRRDKNGERFLSQELVHAAERLREDFVMAQLEHVTFDCVQAFVTALEKRKIPGPNIAPPGTKSARQRILSVFLELGPGLGDMVLRCCCRLEGVEAAENALGWSARSGKIVLRIALQRLNLFYRSLSDDHLMIG